jgi:hypothetical protein
MLKPKNVEADCRLRQTAGAATTTREAAAPVLVYYWNMLINDRNVSFR